MNLKMALIRRNGSPIFFHPMSIFIKASGQVLLTNGRAVIYYWQSFLVNGLIYAYSSLDVQVSNQFTKPGISIKQSATNVLNHYYYSFLGGPYIGGFYYSTLSYSF